MTFGYQVLGFGAFPNRGASGYTIEGSGMFDGDSGYLHQTPGSDGSSTKFTVEAIIKITAGSNQIICDAVNGSWHGFHLSLESEKLIAQHLYRVLQFHYRNFTTLS